MCVLYQTQQLTQWLDLSLNKKHEEKRKILEEQNSLAKDNLVDKAPILTDTTGIKEENVTRMKEKKIKKDIETKELVDENTAEESELINIDEVIGVIQKLQNILLQISEVLSKIDDDHDGSIRLDTVLKVLELIGTENIKLSTKEMDMITQLIFKEEEMETRKDE